MTEELGSWCLLLEGAVLRILWKWLAADTLLVFSRTHPLCWTTVLELLPNMLQNRTLFALLASEDRSDALRALPSLERALVFENFSRPSSVSLTDLEVCKASPHLFGPGDARGWDYDVGCWMLGPGTFVPPYMERRLAEGPKTTQGRAGCPLSVWCLSMTNRDPMSDLDPTGLVWCFPRPVRPGAASFRCRPTASRSYRCGGVFSLAAGLGNDKGPERAAIFIHFSCQPDGRWVSAQHEGGGSTNFASWRDGEWCTVRVRIDWDRKCALCSCRNDTTTDIAEHVLEVPFKNRQCEGCRYMLLYNQTCDFETSWTDILVI